MSAHLYRCQKTYGAEFGLSCVFRQWRADSHCAQLHGYSLGFQFVFACSELDKNGWVLDFGSLKPLKQRLVETFDHKLLVAEDDPEMERFVALGLARVADVLVVPRTGCEAFARMAHGFAHNSIGERDRYRGVRIVSCECTEHAGNSATYVGVP